jgi:ankyrin repeat protein
MRSLLLIVLLLVTLFSCTYPFKDNPLRTTDIYKGKYKELMKAVKINDTVGIQKIVKAESLDLNYADPVYGISLLNWCIFNDKKQSFAKLLQLGADPNWQDSGGHFAPAIIEAAQIDYTSTFLNLAIRYGGNINQLSKRMTGSEAQSPLFAAIYSRRFENVKTLVEKGADINLTQNSIWTPLAEALIHDKMEMAKYLLDHGADYGHLKFWTRTVVLNQGNRPVTDSSGSPVLKADKELTILDLLRDNQFLLNSEDYTIKMQIVQYLKTKGIDYRSYPIPEKISRQHQGDTQYLSSY